LTEVAFHLLEEPVLECAAVCSYPSVEGSLERGVYLENQTTALTTRHVLYVT
jgi:hypothetical protein